MKYPQLPVYGKLNQIETACMLGYDSAFDDDLPQSSNPFNALAQPGQWKAYNHGWLEGDYDRKHP